MLEKWFDFRDLPRPLLPFALARAFFQVVLGCGYQLFAHNCHWQYQTFLCVFRQPVSLKILPDYIWVDRLVQEEFLNLLVAEIPKEKFDVANGNYVQIINTRNLERLEKMLLPKRTVIGGVVDHENRTISPTILKDITFEDQCMQEEIFGPILPVISYTDLDEVISKTIKLPKPLSCYVFSSNQKTRNRIVKEIPFGGGGVNETVMHISNPHLPFGGTGGSGIGSCHGEAGFRAFSHYKSILDKTTMFELPLKYYPHTNKKLWWIKQFFKW